MNNQKGNIAVITLIILSFGIAISLIIWAIATKPKKNPTVLPPTTVNNIKKQDSENIPGVVKNEKASTGTSTDSKEIVNALSNWKTYTNEKIGIEFKYPDSWKITENENSITFQSSEVIKWVKENEDNCKKNTGNCHTELPSYVLELKYQAINEFKKERGADSVDEEKVSINGINYTKYQVFGSMIGGDNYRTEKNGKIYNFWISGEEKISKSIIESFKFTK